MNRPPRYMTSRAVLAIAGAAAALAAGGCGGASSSPVLKTVAASPPPTKLLATVDLAGQVTLTTSSGHAVTRLHSGWYTVFVRVNSTKADFHLTGPSVDSATKAKVPGVALWGIHFLKGTYRYMNDRDPHTTTHVLSVY